MAADDRRPHLTGQEVDLERVMREVVARVQDAGFVLKGGGALVLVYGSIRHTTDLDFDAERPTDMTRRIRRAAQAAGVEIDPETWWWPKGAKAGRDSRRYRVWFYGSQGERLRLQVDTRYRPKPRFSDVTVVDGIRTYKPEALYDQKIAAFRGRNAARDLFDLAFLSKRHGDILTDAQISEAEAITRDMNRLEREVAVKLRDDRILARITTAEDIVYEFRDAVEEQLERRKMKMQVVEQRVLISPSMTREIIELRRLLHGGDEAGKWERFGYRMELNVAEPDPGLMVFRSVALGDPEGLRKAVAALRAKD